MSAISRVLRIALSATLLLACAPSDDPPASEAVASACTASGAEILESAREPVVGDVFHYSWLVRVGTTPSARIRIHRVVRERSPGRPRASSAAVMFQHGDFASFVSNFAPSLVSPAVAPRHTLAVYLAERGVDVWGIDRRWATVPAGAADVSDFGDMGFAVAVADVGRALTFARVLRSASGEGDGRFVLAGFSSGAQLTYSYASEESQRPARERQVKAIVPIDMYARLSPADEPLRLAACARRDDELASLAGGMVDIDNTFISGVGALARSAPDQPSPLWEGETNRSALLTFVARTFDYFAPSPMYHLNAGVFAGEVPTALRYSPELLVADWFAAAPPHQSMRESADMDAIECHDAPLPLADHLADVRVPVFYLGAAGGFGDHGRYTTTRLGSHDVTTHVVRRLDAAHERDDYGHADLLYGDDAAHLAWQALAQWILAH